MTGYTVHTGSTEKFAAGWDSIFRKAGGKQRKSKGKTRVKRAKTRSAPRAAKKKSKRN